jgi:hypothetical protein
LPRSQGVFTYKLHDDVKDLSIRFEDDPNGDGDMGGIHTLVVSDEYMQKKPWWNPFKLSVKWEGLDATVSDEKAERIYLWPGEAEREDQGVSPIRTVREGAYIAKIQLRHRGYPSQVQRFEIGFQVDYGVEF